MANQIQFQHYSTSTSRTLVATHFLASHNTFFFFFCGYSTPKRKIKKLKKYLAQLIIHEIHSNSIRKKIN
jgi:hypothetical protein